MTSRCGVSIDELEALARGELAQLRARELELHATECQSCGPELRWLRAERGLMERRAAATPGLPARMWQSLERRLTDEREARRLIAKQWLVKRVAVVGMAFVAAMAFVGTMNRHHEPASHDWGNWGDWAREWGKSVQKEHRSRRDVQGALDRAERAYQEAIATLEKEYSESGGGQAGERALAQRHLRRLAALRGALARAHAAAGNDPDARLQLLEAYSTYMHSVKTAVLELEEEAEAPAEGEEEEQP